MNLRYRRFVTGAVLFGFFTMSLTDGLFSFLYAEHDHTGEACPICAQMKAASDAVRRLLNGLSASATSVRRHSFLPFSVSMFLAKFSDDTRHQTPITVKVRLND
ncbi:MAG: hypothetical protein LBS00_06620 [Synergistaceae bacterium]|jgi:hypothetical protein|nr:hypothetical protein [Synergistaceae bacterium]